MLYFNSEMIVLKRKDDGKVEILKEILNLWELFRTLETDVYYT